MFTVAFGLLFDANNTLNVNFRVEWFIGNESPKMLRMKWPNIAEKHKLLQHFKTTKRTPPLCDDKKSAPTSNYKYTMGITRSLIKMFHLLHVDRCNCMLKNVYFILIALIQKIASKMLKFTASFSGPAFRCKAAATERKNAAPNKPQQKKYETNRTKKQINSNRTVKMMWARLQIICP